MKERERERKKKEEADRRKNRASLASLDLPVTRQTRRADKALTLT